jgi:hypothetical protein
VPDTVVFEAHQSPKVRVLAEALAHRIQSLTQAGQMMAVEVEGQHPGASHASIIGTRPRSEQGLTALKALEPVTEGEAQWNGNWP